MLLHCEVRLVLQAMLLLLRLESAVQQEFEKTFLMDEVVNFLKGQRIEASQHHVNTLEIVHCVLASRHSIVIDDLKLEPEKHRLSESLADARSLLCMPMRWGPSGKILDAVQTLHLRRMRFVKQHVPRLEHALEQVSFALETAQLHATRVAGCRPRSWRARACGLRCSPPMQQRRRSSRPREHACSSSAERTGP